MTDRIRPVLFNWDGEHMVPVQRFVPLCNRQYIMGEEYALEPAIERSMKSHRHLFAVIKSAWESLPEKISDRFPDPEFLRKWCLVTVGWADHRQIVCDSKVEARRMALTARMLDQYAVIKSSGNVVDIWRAKSISEAAAKRDEFQQVKTAVLDLLASMINVPASKLSKEAEQRSGQKAERRGA